MRLFFYGVLLERLGNWPFLQGIGPGRPATVRGKLYAIPDKRGWYPALTQGEDCVHGMLHEAGNVDLSAIDAFEGTDYARDEVCVGLDPGPPAPSAETDIAHAYLWVAPLPSAAQLIPHGDFARWLDETGQAPFS